MVCSQEVEPYPVRESAVRIAAKEIEDGFVAAESLGQHLSVGRKLRHRTQQESHSRVPNPCNRGIPRDRSRQPIRDPALCGFGRAS
ncbi:MAG: hypothetical protein HQ518_21330 [Rhodopirellula sp.]|nr:hypothetical protein [Rhodopirellula sp.]